LPAANAWGCESSIQSSKYVAKVETDAVGGIRVTATGFGDTTIDGKFVTLIPAALGNATITTSAPLAQWVCGNTAAVAGSSFVTTVASKFLPGSCRGV